MSDVFFLPSYYESFGLVTLEASMTEKPIILRDSRYNQQLAKGASIIEVGATGNTMEQCLNSMKYLSKVLSEVLVEE